MDAESSVKKPVKLVIIDDDEDLLYTFNRSLLNRCYLTVALTDSQNIVSILQNFNPDLILIDIRLKQADGRDVCRFLKMDLRFQNPVILFSSHDYDSRTITGSLADGFVLKTSDHSAMIRYISQYLEC